jgi:hypothetical protein
MDIDELSGGISTLFGAERDIGIDGRERPHSRLTAEYGLDFSYLETHIPEGWSAHPDSRVCMEGDERLDALVQNMAVPNQLFEAGLRLFADSMVAYHEQSERTGPLRYYPPIILTFWSAFETFVRELSIRFVVMARDIPIEISDFLLERQRNVDKNGNVKTSTKYQSALDRYRVLLRYAYDYKMDRGSRVWQQLESANDLRDYYTHLDVTMPRKITSKELSQFMESVLLGIIWPSSQLGKTLLLGVYYLYADWFWLSENAKEFTEQPPLIGFDASKRYAIPANFSNVDRDRFPNSEELHARFNNLR